MISLADVSKSFDAGRTFAVRNVTLEVADGETVVLLGSSGSGKSTTLKLINRLVEPTSGQVRVDGQLVHAVDVLRLRRGIGYVFQGIGLFPHLTVAANAAIVLRLLGWPRRRREGRASEVLELVGLDPAQFGRRLPGELSGGQQQRVGVARALAADPAHLLMDEPFGALDTVTREALQQEVLRLKRELRKTIVFVTHDVFEAVLLGDRIGVMHEGRLEQIGRPDELIRAPATPFVAELFGRARQAAALLANAP